MADVDFILEWKQGKITFYVEMSRKVNKKIFL